MLLEVGELNRLKVDAIDGAIGAVKDVYFDDVHWVIRHMVIAAGGWLNGRHVLISPMSVSGVRWADKTMQVNLTRKQVMDSPPIDTGGPLSRQHEIDYYNYYGYANYWAGTRLSSLAMYPIPWVGASPDAAFVRGRLPDEMIARDRKELLDIERESGGTHLRSAREVLAYQIMARDGPIGSVEEFLFDDQTWAIRCIVVDTGNWLPGKHVLIRPGWVEQVSWSEHEAVLNVPREVVETSPEYDRPAHLARKDEAGSTARHDGGDRY
jgi:uncharacterized protein YrrD